MPSPITVVLSVVALFVFLCVTIYYVGPGRPQRCRCGNKVYGFPKYCPKCGADISQGA